MISLQDRLGNESLRLESLITGRQAQMWTALPGIVQTFDPKALTCEVQVAIMGKRVLEDGTVETTTLPLLLDCPVVFPRGGGCSLTFPIKSGDECLVVFSCRAIDFWWQLGGVQAPAEPRMHDLSDGFVIPGPYSQPNVIADVSTSCVELRTDDRKAYVSLNPNSHEIHVETAGDVTANVTGSVTASVGADMSATVGGSATLTVTGSAMLKAASVTIDSPQTHVTGALTVDGLITGGGGMVVSGGGGATVTGNFTLNGSLSATDDVTAGGISLMHHVHTEQGDGSDVSPPK